MSPSMLHLKESQIRSTSMESGRSAYVPLKNDGGTTLSYQSDLKVYVPDLNELDVRFPGTLIQLMSYKMHFTSYLKSQDLTISVCKQIIDWMSSHSGIFFKFLMCFIFLHFNSQKKSK